MGTNFHANQYEQTFTPHRIQNWEVPKNINGKFPDRRAGFTRIKTNDLGHLLPNVPRCRSSPWGTFVGTWDMPTKLPGTRITNPTARSEVSLIRAHKIKDDADVVLSGSLKPRHTVEPMSVKEEAPEGQVPVGMVCLPKNGNSLTPQDTQPCPQTETVHYDANQPRAMSRKASRESLQWPESKAPVCKSPVPHSEIMQPIVEMKVNHEEQPY